jgi:hypothetical protein
MRLGSIGDPFGQFIDRDRLVEGSIDRALKPGNAPVARLVPEVPAIEAPCLNLGVRRRCKI